MKLILKILFNTLSILLAAYLLPGVHVGNFLNALILALILGILNGTLGKLLKWVSCLFNILTLGLLSLVINAAMVMLADYIMEGFVVDNFWWALLFSICVSTFSWILNRLLKDEKKKNDTVKLLDKDGNEIKD